MLKLPPIFVSKTVSEFSKPSSTSMKHSTQSQQVKNVVPRDPFLVMQQRIDAKTKNPYVQDQISALNKYKFPVTSE